MALEDRFETFPESLRQSSNFRESWEGFIRDYNRILELGKDHILTAPLVQVCSVCVNNSSKNETQSSYHIFGKIDAVDKDCTIGLYDRKKECPEIISGDNSHLCLTGPYCPILMSGSNLVFELYANTSSSNVKILADSFSFEDNVEGYGKVAKKKIRGITGWSASISYFLIPFGAVATVSVVPLPCGTQERDENDECFLQGSIVANYDKSYLRMNTRGDTSTRLFNSPSNDLVHVPYGEPIPMARSLLVVPAFSSLSIYLDLSFSGDRLVKDKATFEPGLMGAYEQVFDNIEKGVSLRVTVEWKKISRLLPNFPSYPVPQPSWLGTRHPLSLNVRRKVPRLELFSVYIGRRDDKALGLYGNIEVSDDYGKHKVFNKQRNNRELIFAEMTSLSLSGPNAEGFVGNALGVKVDLSDDENDVYIKGYLSWNFVNNISHELWFNNRKCSLIRGEGGFATIQYTIFSNPTQAKIKANIVFKSYTSCDVYGRIVVGYGDHDYATEFEQEYYKTMLLDRTEKAPLRLENGSMIPMSKTCVVVPSDSHLVISVYLSSEDLDQGFLNDTVEIKFGEVRSVLEAQHATLEFLVDWIDE